MPSCGGSETSRNPPWLPQQHTLALARPLLPHELDERHFALRRSDCRAVLGSDVGDVIGAHDPGGAGHVLHNEAGRAGNEPAQMPGGLTGVIVVAAARARSDDHLDPLALVEALDVIVRSEGGCGQRERCGCNAQSSCDHPPLWRLRGAAFT